MMWCKKFRLVRPLFIPFLNVGIGLICTWGLSLNHYYELIKDRNWSSYSLDPSLALYAYYIKPNIGLKFEIAKRRVAYAISRGKYNEQLNSECWRDKGKLEK